MLGEEMHAPTPGSRKLEKTSCHHLGS